MRNVSSPFDPVTDSLFWKPILHHRVGTLEGRRSLSRRLIGLDRRVRNRTVNFFRFDHSRECELEEGLRGRGLRG